MSLLPTLIFLALLLGSAAAAVRRARQARRFLTAPEAVAGSAHPAPEAVVGSPPVSRLSLVSGIVAAVTIAVFQWLVFSLPGWAVVIWVPAALALVWAAWEAARWAPHLPWLRPGRRKSDLTSAAVEGAFAFLVVTAVIASVVVAQW